MSVVEYRVRTNAQEITSTIDMTQVNECIVHHRLPTFHRLEAARNKANVLMVVKCQSEKCSRCCDGYYSKDPESEIVGIWNKWNPNAQGSDTTGAQ